MKLRVVTAVLVLAFISLIGLSISKAQGDGTRPVKPECQASALMGAASQLKPLNDQATDMQTLNAFAEHIYKQRILCYGFTFSGTGEKVLDPFVLPKGTWKVVGTSNGFLIVVGNSLTGSDCDSDQEITLVNANREQATVGAEKVLPVRGDCRLVLSISNTSTDWTVTFAPIE
jgi:hypothetical protein